MATSSNISTRFEKYDNKGLSALVNIGNTCFANTCMQILSHTYELNDLMDSIESLNKTSDSEINHKTAEHEMMYEWNGLRNLMWSKNCVIKPSRFISTIHRVATEKKNDIFTYAGNQHDITEFLLFIIDCFHTAIARPQVLEVDKNRVNGDALAIKCLQMFSNTYSKEYSEIIELFYGIQLTILTTEEGDKLNHIPEPFCSINLSLPPHSPGANTNPTLDECFEYYTRNEHLTGDNQLFNEKSKKLENAYTRVMFWGLPPILILDIKRFNSQGGRHVQFPLEELHLSKYVVGPNNTKYIYDLYGVGNHIGGNRCGHYFAFVKSSVGKWYAFNDNIVKMVDSSRIITPYAYCLFYRIREHSDN